MQKHQNQQQQLTACMQYLGDYPVLCSTQDTAPSFNQSQQQDAVQCQQPNWHAVVFPDKSNAQPTPQLKRVVAIIKQSRKAVSESQ
jgi:hypothetical protein